MRIPIKNPIMGGIAESKYMGVENSMSEMVGIDVHSTPGIIQAQYQLTKDSGIVVDSLVRTIVYCSDGNAYLLSGSSGKIYKRTSAGVYSLIYTTVPAAGDAGCLYGAEEYNGYIYWATQSRLHRTSASAPFVSVDLNWATFTDKNDSYHPMYQLNGVLYIGDGQYVAQVDENGVFTAEALDLLSNAIITALGSVINDLLIGTRGRNSIFRWDTYSVSWSVEDTIPEEGINSFLKADNYIIVNAGLNGNLYHYNGQELVLLKSIPGAYNSSATGKVYPNATENMFGIPVFGFSQTTGNPGDFGVYSFGGKNPAFPRILNYEYPVIPSTTMQKSDIIVGALKVIDNVLLVSWKDTYGTPSYGVSKIDYTTRLNGAYFSTRVITVEDDKVSRFSKIAIPYASMPSGCSISLYYKKDYGSWTEITTRVDTIRKTVYAEQAIDATRLELKVVFNTSTSDSPQIEGVIVYVQ